MERMYHGEHGDLLDDGECECDRDGQLHGAGDYWDHGDADDTSHYWDFAAVYGDGYGDGGLYERGDMVHRCAGRK
jgi:hypothetical protein